MGIMGGLTFINIGLDSDVAFFIVASKVGPLVAVTISGFPPVDVSWVAFSMVDAAEQPISKVAKRTIVNQYLIYHLQDKHIESKTSV
jgi:hypothetical protein